MAVAVIERRLLIRFLKVVIISYPRSRDSEQVSEGLTPQTSEVAHEVNNCKLNVGSDYLAIMGGALTSQPRRGRAWSSSIMLFCS